MHKNRHLIKPMMIVTSDGYIISSIGPYYSDFHNNDASILKHVVSENLDNIKHWLQPDDVLIVDRGFRDAAEVMKSLGFKFEMPFFLPKGKTQHTTEEGNYSRFVTKVRWVVEAVNGRVKQWKIFDGVIQNSQIPTIGDDLKVVCSICNAYRPPLIIDTSRDEEIAFQMVELSKFGNELMKRVKEEQLHKRSCTWKKIDDNGVVPDFPRLTHDELRQLTVGVYQLSQAKNFIIQMNTFKMVNMRFNCINMTLNCFELKFRVDI